MKSQVFPHKRKRIQPPLNSGRGRPQIPRKRIRSFTTEFEKYSANGIDAVLINTITDPKLLACLVPLAKKQGLEVHAWIMAMNRPGDTVALKHPEWYAVSREGKSTFDTRPYVGYYQWLCPTGKASRNHVLDLVEGLAKVQGVTGVHLDYIRFCDIFLPIGLLPKYDLKQEEELPRFDFCYCDTCVAEFEKLHGKNPRKMKNPAIDIEWKQFRLNKVKARGGRCLQDRPRQRKTAHCGRFSLSRDGRPHGAAALG